MSLVQKVSDTLAKAKSALPQDDESRRRWAMYFLFGGGALVALNLLKGKSKPALPTYAPFPIPTDDSYDVAIIGAGPSGATCGFYLSRAGRKVVVLEKAKFPRDKYCGDAVTTLAQKHLKVMGVLQELNDAGQMHWSRSGGFVSPGGYSFIGNSAKELKRDEEGVVVAVKRIDMDEKIAMACRRSGANLVESTEVIDAEFNKQTGFWTVKCLQDDGEGNQKPVEFRARVLVSADGAPSKFAHQKGYVKTEPDGVCSRSYVTGNHNFQCDGVVFYPPELLPGYCAILRHAKDELGFCTYIIPGGPLTNNDLHRIHHDILNNDPYVSKALAGTNINVERMKAATLRLGGIPRSSGEHFLIIGDAAGFIDPLTGEGIQYAMESAEFAADVLIDALKSGDLGAEAMQKYHDKWYSEWGREFYWSMKMSLALYRFPIFLDAAAKLIGKRGARFLAEWANVMTGTGSKLWFLHPSVGPFIFFEAVGIFVGRLFGRGRPQPK